MGSSANPIVTGPRSCHAIPVFAGDTDYAMYVRIFHSDFTCLAQAGEIGCHQTMVALPRRLTAAR